MRLHIRLRIRRDSEEPLKGKDVEPFFWLEEVMLIALLVTLAPLNSSLDTDTYLQEGRHTMYVYQIASNDTFADLL